MRCLNAKLLIVLHFPLLRTPPQFLHEIVLVDDKSELLHLHEQLDKELMKPFYQGKVKVVRNKQREGLIRARNIGGIAATGNFILNIYSRVGVPLRSLSLIAFFFYISKM